MGFKVELGWVHYCERCGAYFKMVTLSEGDEGMEYED